MKDSPIKGLKSIRKLEFYIDGDKLIPFRRGYSLGTVYDMHPDDYYRIKLMNVGYSPSEKDFYFTYNVHLPKKVIEYLESKEENESLRKELEELGIVRRNEVSKMINTYRELEAKTEMEKQKILALNRTLKLKSTK